MSLEEPVAVQRQVLPTSSNNNVIISSCTCLRISDCVLTLRPGLEQGLKTGIQDHQSMIRAPKMDQGSRFGIP